MFGSRCDTVEPAWQASSRRQQCQELVDCDLAHGGWRQCLLEPLRRQRTRLIEHAERGCELQEHAFQCDQCPEQAADIWWEDYPKIQQDLKDIAKQLDSRRHARAESSRQQLREGSLQPLFIDTFPPLGEVEQGLAQHGWVAPLYGDQDPTQR